MELEDIIVEIEKEQKGIEGDILLRKKAKIQIKVLIAKVLDLIISIYRSCNNFCRLGYFRMWSAFCRRVSYFFFSRCIFRSSACRAVLWAASPSSPVFSFWAEGNLVSPTFLISLAAVSNKMISLSNPRGNFSLFFDAL